MDIISPDEDWSTGGFVGELVEFKYIEAGRDDGPEAGLLEGYASTFGGVDRQHDTVEPGAFAETLAHHKERGTSPALLWSHRQAEPVGKITGLGEDGRGLRFRGKLNLKTVAGLKAYEHAKAGDVTGVSIGYAVRRGGASYKEGRRQLKSVDLHEVSLVATPSDLRAQLVSVKSIEGPITLETKSALETLLTDAGLSRAAARKVVAGGWDALAGPEADPHQFDDFARAMRAGTLALRALKG